MKKVSVFIFSFIMALNVFAYDYREVLFGNSFSSIELCDSNKLNEISSSYTKISGLKLKKNKWLFNEKHDSTFWKNLYRLVSSDTISDITSITE